MIVVLSHFWCQRAKRPGGAIPSGPTPDCKPPAPTIRCLLPSHNYWRAMTTTHVSLQFYFIVWREAKGNVIWLMRCEKWNMKKSSPLSGLCDGLKWDFFSFMHLATHQHHHWCLRRAEGEDGDRIMPQKKPGKFSEIIFPTVVLLCVPWLVPCASCNDYFYLEVVSVYRVEAGEKRR